jgi:hypothetical protein
MAAAMLAGCSVNMTPPGQNTAAYPVEPRVETVVETRAVPVVERRRASKLDAYRGLTEQVYGQYLDSTTTVADMAVISDTFRTQVEGVIYGAKVVSIAPVGEDTYETTMSLDQDVVDDLRALYLSTVAQR